MNLFMRFSRQSKNQLDDKGIFKEVRACKPEELENLLKRLEIEIKKTEGKNEHLYMAKTIITSRLASMRTRNQK